MENSAAARSQGREWKRRYHRRVFAVDALIITSVVAFAQFATVRLLPTDQVNGDANWQHVTALSATLVIAWLTALELQQSRDISLVGIGAEEYRRVASATMWVFGMTAVLGLLLQERLSRSFLGTALFLGLVSLVIGRHYIRSDLARRRTRGEFTTRVVVLGNPESVRVLCESLRRSADAGYRVVGVCIPDFHGEVGEQLVMPTGPVPVLGDGGAVESALGLSGADMLAVAAAEQLGHEKMKRLVWRLESLGVGLIVVPGVTDIAGTRLLMRPIDNLPLFHIAPPRQGGPSAVAKRLFDLCLATAALVAASPIMAGAALAIKLGDGGPVIFRQERVGHGGRPFKILKFRTMRVDAEALKGDERTASGECGVFFKSACDSRITRVGSFLRATSIDELPQLVNVIAGSMSMVGPRPLLVGEGESVEDFVERRILVKPGITGLWQISGRSDVPDEERIRLDHSYVDNWSCIQDLVIVWRTARAVLKRKGAY